MQLEPLIICIDGTAGSGKSTIAKQLAEEIQIIHLNSGLIYRTVAFLARSLQVDLTNEQQMVNILEEITCNYHLNEKFVTEYRASLRHPHKHDNIVGIDKRHDELKRLLHDPQELVVLLSSVEAGEYACQIASFPSLRKKIVEIQQQVGSLNSLVCEGRDSGTVVFPNSPAKFFLDANLDIRAERRLGQSKSLEKNSQNNQQISIDTIREMVSKRDERDRKNMPQAADSIFIDTSFLSAKMVINKISDILTQKGLI